VATVTDDARLFEVPKLRVCALKFTETARARIVKVRFVAWVNREGNSSTGSRNSCCTLGA
jgi:hypothetical protein